jgi:hypothetical protein
MLQVVGAHIAQGRESSAIAVAQIELRRDEDNEASKPRKDWHYTVRFLERISPGTSYPKLASRLGEVCANVTRLAGDRPTLVVNVTGLGSPVTDFLKDEVSYARRVWAVHFNHGDRRVEDRDRREVVLGKAYLVSRIKVLLVRGYLQLPETPDARRLAEELLEYEIRPGQVANDLPGAFKVGTRDEFVTAVGLAVQKEPSASVYPGRTFYHL